ncbi:unnamed protein product [Peniophora sp. CBMAI 1063]|nr:unnamed protein product [Peniophora sp. CBMAI 1063]
MLEFSAEVIADFATATDDNFRMDPFNPSTEDTTRRGTTLIYRDVLLFYTIFNAVKSSDFGRVEILLGQATIWFAGAGGHNYWNELLHFIQNLRKDWPEDFDDIVLDNMLMNTSCCEDQKRLIHILKLREISPGANIWRRLLRVFRETLGVYKSSSHPKIITSMLVSRVRAKTGDRHLFEFDASHATSRARTVDMLEKGVHDVQTARLADFHRRRRALMMSSMYYRLEEVTDSDKNTMLQADNNLGLEALIDKSAVVVEVEEIFRSEGFEMGQFITRSTESTE